MHRAPVLRRLDGVGQLDKLARGGLGIGEVVDDRPRPGGRDAEGTLAEVPRKVSLNIIRQFSSRTTKSRWVKIASEGIDLKAAAAVSDLTAAR